MNVGAKIATKDDVTMVTVGCGYLRSGQDYLNCDYSKPETQQVVTFCQKTGKLALLGIINYSGGSFKPNQTITRQETATMLMRLAKVMGLEEPNASKVSFTEQSAIASWFADGVVFISACQDPQSGKRVMGGTGNGRFDPTGSYTREQSIMTLIRLYHVVNG